MQLSKINTKTWVVGFLTLITGIGTFGFFLPAYLQLPPSSELGGLIAEIFLFAFGISFLIGLVTLVLLIWSKNYLKPTNVDPKTEHWKNVIYTGLLIGSVVIVAIVYFSVR